jgi:hypothetical protein
MKIKKTLLSLAAVITTFSSAAAANGYWEYVEVCDYEQVEVQQPKTSCVYSGVLTTYTNGYSGINHYSTHTANSHFDCSSSLYESQYRNTFNNSTQEWDMKHYTGVIPLIYQNQHFATSTETVKVEGSCRTEQVWIELCNNCQIP